MKIRKLQLTGYKVFDELELDFTDLEGNTLDTVVLAGVNGSGKTSLLDLLEAIFSIEEVEPYQIPIKSFHSNGIVSSHTYSLKRFSHKINSELVKNCNNILMSVEVSGISTNNLTNCEWKASDTIEYQDLAEKIHRSRVNGEPIILDLQLYDLKSEQMPENLLCLEVQPTSLTGKWSGELIFSCLVYEWNKTSQLCYIHTDFLQKDKIEQDVAKYLIDSLINGVVQKRELPAGLVIQEIINRINNMFDGMDMKTKLVDITATAPIFESFNGKKISINQLSSGEKQLFCQAVYLQKLNLQDSIILIDEPETSLHPTWQRNILKLYQNIGKNNQIIVATHSPHVIASVKPESLFVLYPNAETAKIEPINMAKAHKHTKGVEPNRILQEIMGMEDLRDPETRQRIDEIAELLRLHPEQVDLPENEAKIEKLRNDLGKGDPFIIRMNHQLLLIKRRNLSHEIYL